MFLSPLAWVVLAVVQFIMAWVFLVQVVTFSLMQQQYLMFQQRAPGAGDLIVAPLLSTASVVMLLVVPLLTMRPIAEGKRSGTITLLRAAPVASAGIVRGKYRAVLLFVALLVGVAALLRAAPAGGAGAGLGQDPAIPLCLPLLVAMRALVPASLAAGTDPDWGRLAAGVLGLFLMVAAFAAAGLFLSTVTRQPVVAAI